MFQSFLKGKLAVKVSNNLFINSSSESRKERAIRLKSYFNQQKTIPRDISSQALSIVKMPVNKLLVIQKEKDNLIDDFFNKKDTVDFIGKWRKLGNQQATIRENEGGIVEAQDKKEQPEIVKAQDKKEYVTSVSELISNVETAAKIVRILAEKYLVLEVGNVQSKFSDLLTILNYTKTDISEF